MSGGVGKALDEVMDDLPEAEEFVQAALFDDLDATETGALDAPSPLSALFEPKKRARGRPHGSRNRRTEAVVGWLLAQHRHPVLVMMEAYSMAPAELAARLGLSKGYRTRKGKDGAEEEVALDTYSNDVLLDIFKLQVRMAESAARYVAQPLPQAVQIDAQAGVTISFEGVSLPARGEEAGKSAVIEGEWKGLLPAKSDGESRNDP